MCIIHYYFGNTTVRVIACIKKNNNFKTFGKTLLNFAILYMLQERNVLPLNSLGF